MRRYIAIAALVAAASTAGFGPSAVADVEKPAALVTEGVPPVPRELAERTRPYLEFRTAAFRSWHPRDRSILITTRFGNTAQLHRVKTPGSSRNQLTFEIEPISDASWAPTKGDVIVVQKDVGGNEFFQLYTTRARAPDAAD